MPKKAENSEEYEFWEACRKNPKDIKKYRLCLGNSDACKHTVFGYIEDRICPECKRSAEWESQ